MMFMTHSRNINTEYELSDNGNCIKYTIDSYLKYVNHIPYKWKKIENVYNLDNNAEYIFILSSLVDCFE